MRKFNDYGGKRKCFIPFDLPSGVVREVERLQGELKKKNFFLGRYVEGDMMYVTLEVSWGC